MSSILTGVYGPWLKWISQQQESMRDQLIEWSSINSGSFNLPGLDRMSEVLQQAFSGLGASLEVLTLAPGEDVDAKGQVYPIHYGNALRFRKRPEAPLQFVLAGHMDTVFGIDHSFQTATFLDENTLNGPGVADMKGGILIMLTALQALEQSPFAANVGWEVILNPDEEVGSHGSAPLFAEAAARNHFGLLFEPAINDQGILAGSRKGSGNFTVVVKGRAAHAGREHHLGRNAICAAASLIQSLNELNGKRPDFTLNIGTISAGKALNVVPDLAVFKFNIRIHTIEDGQWAQEQFNQLIQQLNQQEGYQVKLYGTVNRVPKRVDAPMQRLFDLLHDCGQALDIPIEWQPTGGCSDGNNLSAAGLANLDTLGVRGGAIHSSQEYIKLDSLTERAQLVALLLMRLGAGELIWK